jgi:hypothetical protein
MDALVRLALDRAHRNWSQESAETLAKLYADGELTLTQINQAGLSRAHVQSVAQLARELEQPAVNVPDETRAAVGAEISQEEAKQPAPTASAAKLITGSGSELEPDRDDDNNQAMEYFLDMPESRQRLAQRYSEDVKNELDGMPAGEAKQRLQSYWDNFLATPEARARHDNLVPQSREWGGFSEDGEDWADDSGQPADPSGLSSLTSSQIQEQLEAAWQRAFNIHEREKYTHRPDQRRTIEEISADEVIIFNGESYSYNDVLDYSKANFGTREQQEIHDDNAIRLRMEGVQPDYSRNSQDALSHILGEDHANRIMAMSGRQDQVGERPETGIADRFRPELDLSKMVPEQRQPIAEPRPVPPAGQDGAKTPKSQWPVEQPAGTRPSPVTPGTPFQRPEQPQAAGREAQQQRLQSRLATPANQPREQQLQAPRRAPFEPYQPPAVGAGSEAVQNAVNSWTNLMGRAPTDQERQEIAQNVQRQEMRGTPAERPGMPGTGERAVYDPYRPPGQQEEAAEPPAAVPRNGDMRADPEYQPRPGTRQPALMDPTAGGPLPSPSSATDISQEEAKQPAAPRDFRFDPEYAQQVSEMSREAMIERFRAARYRQ